MTRGNDNRLALGRLGALVEQIEALVRSGRQVILVTSGRCQAPVCPVGGASWNWLDPS